jgi:hypothetical protein
MAHAVQVCYLVLPLLFNSCRRCGYGWFTFCTLYIVELVSD